MASRSELLVVIKAAVMGPKESRLLGPNRVSTDKADEPPLDACCW